MEWRHIKLRGANQALLNARDTKIILGKKLSKLFKELSETSHRVLLHCAAGIHRTGTIAYTLLRLSGRTRADAMEDIKKIRMDTYKGVGEWRIDLAETIILPVV